MSSATHEYNELVTRYHEYNDSLEEIQKANTAYTVLDKQKLENLYESGTSISNECKLLKKQARVGSDLYKSCKFMDESTQIRQYQLTDLINKCN